MTAMAEARWSPTIWFVIAIICIGANADKFPLLMPKIHPENAEAYLCTPVRLNEDGDKFYITGFEPNATQHTAHHMLIYGCEEPGSMEPVWNCGEMAASTSENSALESNPPCRSGPQIIYAWAKDAPKLELPKGVGFR